MNVINTYLYTQNLVAVTTDERVGNTLTMYYTPNVKVYRGVDQTVRIQFKNRDNKTVSLAQKTALFILTDADNGTTLLSKTIDPIDAAKGTGKVRFTDADTLNLDAKYYTYAIKVTDGEGVENPAYVDDNLDASGTIQVMDGVYPKFVSSVTENFDGGNTGDAIYIDPFINRNEALHTAFVKFSSAFTGTLNIQVSLSPQTQALNNDDFITLKTISYTSQTDNDSVSWNGVYSAVRFVRSGTELSEVLYRP